MASQDSREWSPRTNCSLTTEFALVQENILLQNERITQLFVIQAEQNPFLWFGVLFVDHGPYSGAVLRFNMYIEETYPDCSCPKIVFCPIPCHPLVNPTTGELDTKNAFPSWNSNKMKLYELLIFVKRVIRQADEYIMQIKDLILDHSPASKDEPNELARHTSEQLPMITQAKVHQPRSHNPNVIATVWGIGNCAGFDDSSDLAQLVEAYDPDFRELFSWFHHTLNFYRMYVRNIDEFHAQVEDFKQSCYEQLLSRPVLCGDDDNAIVFTPWNPDIHEPIRRCVLAGRFNPPSLFASYHKETDSVSFIPGRGLGLD